MNRLGWDFVVSFSKWKKFPDYHFQNPIQNCTNKEDFEDCLTAVYSFASLYETCQEEKRWIQEKRTQTKVTIKEGRKRHVEDGIKEI
jgi:hypothetical protein